MSQPYAGGGGAERGTLRAPRRLRSLDQGHDGACPSIGGAFASTQTAPTASGPATRDERLDQVRHYAIVRQDVVETDDDEIKGGEEVSGVVAKSTIDATSQKWWKRRLLRPFQEDWKHGLVSPPPAGILLQMHRRLNDLIRFYSILDCLERRIGGRRLLASCKGRSGWPVRGIYFFMEETEGRKDSGEGLRVVRVGTHGLTSTSQTTIWNRLSQHRGTMASGGGNHRGSIFRLLVGSTLLKEHGAGCPTWGIGNNALRDVRVLEQPFEQEVSRIVGAMPFLWLEIDDAPSRESARGYVERNAIALLSNFAKPPLDPPSSNWRGSACDRGKGLVRDSGLWNQNHVAETYDPAFLDVLDRFVNATRAE